MTYTAAEDRYDRMTYRRCGRSGLQLPAVSLGLWHNFGHDRPLDAKLAVRTRALTTAIRGLAPSVEPALERWFTPSFARQRPDVVDAVRRTMLANDPVGYLRSYAIFAQGDDELVNDIARVRIPTLSTRNCVPAGRGAHAALGSEFSRTASVPVGRPNTGLGYGSVVIGPVSVSVWPGDAKTPGGAALEYE